jgi:hypothetical protein
MVVVIGHGYQASEALHAERNKLITLIAGFCAFWTIVGFLAASIL